MAKSNAIFDFATDYYYKNELQKPENFQFTEANWNDFKTYLQKIDFTYQTNTEKELEKLLATAKDEGMEQLVLPRYKEISTAIEADKKQELEDKKPEITSLLTDEIIKRYFYKEGLYEYYVQHNPEIKEAQKVLNDATRYSTILK